MSIYVIADLHLSFSQDKPMDIFGDNWNNHANKIRKNWEEVVTDKDLVIIPGDFSWAMNLKDAYKDFEFLNKLPGKKILLKGNHDYWWTTVTNMDRFIKENNFKNIKFLHNNSYLNENKIICGTRGWSFTDTENSLKMINRENERLKISLKTGIDLYGEEKEIIVCMHYPPLTQNTIRNIKDLEFVETLQQYHVKKCFYGHLHGSSHKDAIEQNVKGIEFKLISADYLDFKLYKVN